MRSLLVFIALAIVFASAAEYKLPTPPQCGNQLGDSAEGTAVGLTEFPWLAFLSYGDTTKGSVACSGVMISRGHVMTYAECLHSYKYSLHFWPGLYLGMYDWKSERLCVVDQCKSNKVHYQAQSEDGPLMVLRIPDDVAVDNKTRPICLPSAIDSYTLPAPNEELYLTGWGKDNFYREGESIKTKRVMTVVDTKVCEERLGREVAKTDFCVEGQIPGCFGYLGGPLMKKMGDSWVLVGLFTDESACGEGRSLHVVPNIATKAEWIDSILDKMY